MLEKYWREIGLALVGLIMVGVGVMWTRWPGGEEVEILSAEIAASESGQIAVDVSGEVAKPGVYKVEPGTRVGEVLEMAGGVSDSADGEWAAKYLNQAEKVKDGQKIYIPSKNNQETRNNNQTSSKININTAGQGELEGLAGVGPVTASKIISGRPYSRVEELVERKIVGQKVWGEIKDAVSVW